MNLLKVIYILAFSIFFWIFSFSFMFALAIGTMIGTLFAPYQKVHFWVSRPGFEWIARIATLGKLRIYYHPDFSPDVDSVFCMNHTNLLDAHTASAAIPRPFCGLMNSWQFHIPFYGWLMRLSKGIPVDKRKRSEIYASIVSHAQVRRKEQMSILVFPEAHRTRDGKIQQFKRGVFRMARDVGYPVVPIAVRGMYDVNRKGSYLFRPGPVDVYVGPQFDTENLEDHELEVLVDSLRNWVSDFVEGKMKPITKEAA